MSESAEIKKNGWGCKCCDGNDEKCQCFHHKFSGHMVLKKILMLVILGSVFMLGVGVGKLLTYHEFGFGKGGAYGIYNMHKLHHGGYGNDAWGIMPYYPYGNGYMPMTGQRYYQGIPQNATSTQSVK